MEGAGQKERKREGKKEEKSNGREREGKKKHDELKTK